MITKFSKEEQKDIDEMFRLFESEESGANQVLHKKQHNTGNKVVHFLDQTEEEFKKRAPSILKALLG
jgi:hypothetical protein